MSNLFLSTQWNPNINQVETTEPILGGDGGNANLATRQLGENILWLRRSMQLLIPMGYIYHSHDTDNPKPYFDELLGVPTYWQRVRGKVLVGTDPSDVFISNVGSIIGHKGLTGEAKTIKPQTYPLQATNMFERYDPDASVTPRWIIYPTDNSVGVGSDVGFVVTGVHTDESESFNWEIYEGDFQPSDMVDGKPSTGIEKTLSGQSLLTNNSATIEYTAMDVAAGSDLPTRHIAFHLTHPADDFIVLPIVVNNVVETFSLTLGVENHTVSQSSGSMTFKNTIPIYKAVNVSNSPLTAPEFNANGHRYHTFGERDNLASRVGMGGVNDNYNDSVIITTENWEMTHIWVRLPDEYVDLDLYDFEVSSTIGTFIYEVMADQVYNGLYKTATPDDEETHLNWIKLMQVRAPFAAKDYTMPLFNGAVVTVKVLSKG